MCPMIIEKSGPGGASGAPVALGVEVHLGGTVEGIKGTQAALDPLGASLAALVALNT